MKNLFRLSVVVLLTGAISSCTKSSNELTEPGSATGNAKIGRSRESATAEAWTKIFPGLTQPRETVLGNPDSYLYDGDQAVFYVLLSTEVVSDAFIGSLTLTDFATGTPIQTFNMLPNTDPAAAGLQVPEEITQSQLPFMFAIIDIDAQYVGRTVSLESTVEVINAVGGAVNPISQASLPAAFIVQ